MVIVVSVEMVSHMSAHRSTVHVLEGKPLFIVIILMVVVEAAECNGLSGL